jgi:hypothetical protein
MKQHNKGDTAPTEAHPTIKKTLESRTDTKDRQQKGSILPPAQAKPDSQQ